MRRALLTFVFILSLFGPVVAALAATGPSRAPTAERTIVPASGGVKRLPRQAHNLETAGSAPVTATTTTLDPNVVRLNVTKVLQAEAEQQQTAERQRHVQIGTAITASSGSCSTPATTDLPTIAACIKACESGNYAESSHPNDGSGAFQFVPGTWRHYFALWRDEYNAGRPIEQQVPYYDLAYQAPPWVQDAVMQYAVEHGGAHNWDPSYGNDPCTVNLP